jgi:hypothetical protein
MDKYKEIMNDRNYITSGLGLRKFQVLDFCCTECENIFKTYNSQKLKIYRITMQVKIICEIL